MRAVGEWDASQPPGFPRLSLGGGDKEASALENSSEHTFQERRTPCNPGGHRARVRRKGAGGLYPGTGLHLESWTGEGTRCGLEAGCASGGRAWAICARLERAEDPRGQRL